MLKHLWEKMKEAMITIVPVILIVMILSFTPLFSLTMTEYVIFIVSAIVIILGIGLFSLGSEMAMEPMGEDIGSNMMKTKKIFVVLIIVIILTALITIAEPDVSELLELAHPMILDRGRIVLLLVIGISTGLFLAIGIHRLLKDIRYKTLLLFCYLVVVSLIVIIVLENKVHLLPLALDAGGVTTGAISTPFIMAIGIGAALTVGGRKSKQNSFGFIALCSVGPIVGALLLILISPNSELILTANDLEFELGEGFAGIIANTFTVLGKIALEVFFGLGILTAVFIFINYMFLKLPKNRIKQIVVGLLFAYLGSVLFLTAASIGFHYIGYELGIALAEVSPVWVCIIAFLLGIFVVLAEPAVHMLADQVSDVTTGGVSKKSILIALSIGAGVAVLLSIIRIIFDFSILYYVIPGIVITFGLSLYVPRIYTAIAFDSGGVASGPITLSFIVPLAMGTCTVLQPDNIAEAAFGIVAMVALTPLIAIQLLGFRDIIRKKNLEKSRMKTIINADDEQIINFR